MRAYEIKLKNGKETYNIKLRLTIGSLIEIKKKYKEEASSFILSAISDVERMCYIFGLALNYKNNENKITDGEELYDLLVDNGYEGQGAFMTVLTGIAVNSGVLTEKQKAQIDAYANGNIDKAFEEQFGEDEKNE